MFWYRILAVFRFVVVNVLAPFCKERPYAKPENVGYKSSINLHFKVLSSPEEITLAFRRLDDTIQYNW